MKKAFTLSEVLITLTIIGVVAALTIPSLNNHVGEADKIAKIKKLQSIQGDMIVLSEIANGPMENWPINENVGNMKTKFWPTPGSCHLERNEVESRDLRTNFTHAFLLVQRRGHDPALHRLHKTEKIRTQLGADFHFIIQTPSGY